jgi:surfactin synthase thioesterase subunit
MNVHPGSNPFLHRLKPAAQLRLFCFPNAGGGAALLHSWLNGLPPEIDVCPIHLPGREKRMREEPFRRMETLVQAVCDALEPVLAAPFALFGHSLGSLMAFETALELRRRNLRGPVRLFVSAHAAPDVPRRLSPIHRQPEPQFIESIIERYDAIPPQILADKELMSMFVPVLKADFELLETYAHTPAEPLSCPITALGGVLDSSVAASQLQAWSRQTVSSFQLRLFPGKHFFLREARPEVLRVIGSELGVVC